MDQGIKRNGDREFGVDYIRFSDEPEPSENIAKYELLLIWDTGVLKCYNGSRWVKFKESEEA